MGRTERETAMRRGRQRMPCLPWRLAMVWAAVTAAVTAAMVTGPAEASADAVIDADDLRDAHVRRAIDAIVEELYDRAHPQRFWEPAEPIRGESPQAVGHTALVVLALLHAGESYQSPRLAPAIAYLESAEPDGAYAVAMRAAVWAQLPPRFREHLERDAQWLIDRFSPAVGGWDYRGNPQTQRVDHSIAQYGAMALWEAARRGVDVPDRIWRRMERQFLRAQVADGGWNYQGHGPSTGSMTTAGLMTMFMTQDLLHSRASVDLRRRSNDAPHEQAIERGLEWLGENLAVDSNPGQNRYYTYYMYNLERVGLTSGRKHFAGRDWFRLGAAELISRFCDRGGDGAYTVRERTRTAGRGRAVRNRDLAFTLLFLSRGRVPVAINKLQHSETGWNNRPRDVANFTGWMRRTGVTDINWQVIDPRRPVAEWLDAAMLVIAGDQPPDWLRQHDQVLRDHLDDDGGGAALDPRDSRPAIDELQRIGEYLDRGGMIFAMDEGGGALTRSIERLGRVLAPDGRWRTLPDDHPAYTLHWPIETNRPVLRGLSNGVRELIIIAPNDDFGPVFQQRRTERESIYRTAANVYLYASEQQALRPRLAAHGYGDDYVRDDAPGDAGPGDEDSSDGEAFEPPLRLVRAAHDGRWNPEPGALDVFAEAMADRRQLPVDVGVEPLDAIDRADPPADVVLVSGVDRSDLSAAERQAVQRFVENGGTVVFESVAGLGDFAASIEQNAVTWFRTLSVSMVTSGVVTGEGLAGAVDLREVTYRPAAAERFGTRRTRPGLRGLRIDGRFRVIVSTVDLTHGLLDQPAWGVVGYAPADARDLLANVLLYARATRRATEATAEPAAEPAAEPVAEPATDPAATENAGIRPGVHWAGDDIEP